MLEVRNFTEPEFNKKEILRYALCREETRDVSALLEECIKEVRGELSYRVCCDEFPVTVRENGVDFPFMHVESKALAKNLQGCESAIVFAATVGVGIDRLIAKYTRLSPAKALMLQAIGAERIESLCDAFNNEIKIRLRDKRLSARPRFSPGYGDLPLERQRDIFRALDCPRKIGLTLNESLLMSPSKSVTAIIGVSKTPQICSSGCGECGKSDCEFRRDSK